MPGAMWPRRAHVLGGFIRYGRFRRLMAATLGLSF